MNLRDSLLSVTTQERNFVELQAVSICYRLTIDDLSYVIEHLQPKKIVRDRV